MAEGSNVGNSEEGNGDGSGVDVPDDVSDSIAALDPL